jgi:hypothetical protein
MPYALYSASRKSRVSALFATEQDVWTYVREQELCSEIIEREDMEPRRVLNPGYEIHTCGADD